MRVVEVREFGPPEVLQVVERPDPEPGEDEILIEVEATHVLWVETAVRSGRGQDWFPLRPPYVPGTGVAGTDAATGRRIVAHTGQGDGYADRVVVPAANVVALPDGVSAQQAAALVHDAVTALRLFDTLAVGPHDTVLVVGASGGLGLVSLQLARDRAAGELALAHDTGGLGKVQRVRDLGFDVVDTDRSDWIEPARAALPDGADVVLDNVGGDLGAAAVQLVADGGRWSSHGTPGGSFTTIDPKVIERRRLRVIDLGTVQFDLETRMRLVRDAMAAAARGELIAEIGQTFPLDQAAEAHRAIEERAVFGATLLLP